LQGSAQAAAEVPRQIANANTIFNVLNTLLFIGFTGWFAKMAERLVPDRPAPEGVIVEPEFLEDAALAAPTMALQAVRMELGRVGEITRCMLDDVIPALRDRDPERLDAIARRNDEVDILETAILRYMGKVRSGMLTEQESLEFQGLMSAADNLQSMAEVIGTDIVALSRKAIDLNTSSGEKTRRMLLEVYEMVAKSVELTVQAVRDNDQRIAESVMIMKDGIRDQSERLLARKADRLTVSDPDYLNLVRLEMSFVDQMRRIYTLAKRISKGIVPEAIAQRD
jgi:phosphate:Na+ symporter